MAPAPKRPPTPKHVLRQWFIAHMLVTWRDQHSKALRKIEVKAGMMPSDPRLDDAAVIEALLGLRTTLVGWVASIDELTAPELVQGQEKAAQPGDGGR